MSAATIMMPNTMELAIKAMVEDAVTQTVTTLSEKHGFDQEEALRDLDLSGIKFVRKRGPSPKSEKKKKTTDKPKTKRGTTGYIEFGRAERPDVTKELKKGLAEGEKLSPQDTVRGIGARWRALSKEEQAVWNEKAKEIKSAATSEASSPAESDEEASKKEEEPKAEVKTEKEEVKTSTKKSGYFKFAEEKRAGIRKDLKKDLAEGEKIEKEEFARRVLKAVAAAWSALDKEEQAVWNEKAKAE